MPYLFTPPTRGRRVSLDHKDILWSRVTVQEGITVVKTTSNTYRQESVHDPDALDIDTVWMGGRTHTVDDTEAAALAAAGYGANLTEVAP